MMSLSQFADLHILLPNVQIELSLPVAMDEGLRFAIRDSGRTVGAGVVTKVLP